jgi:hypothetical protein
MDLVSFFDRERLRMYPVVDKNEWERIRTEASKTNPLSMEDIDKMRNENCGVNAESFPFAILEEKIMEEGTNETINLYGVKDWITAYRIYEMLELEEIDVKLERNIMRNTDGFWEFEFMFGGGIVPHFATVPLRKN